MALPILGAIGAGVAGFFGITLLATSLTAILIGGVIVVGAALLTRKMMTQKGPSDPGMLINKNSSSDPIPLVYGERRVGATRTFIRSAGATGGAGNEYLHIVYTICEGPIEAIEKIYFNDYEVWDRVTGISTSAGEDNINFTGLLEINNHLGSTTQAADANLLSRFSSEWTSNHRGRGIAYSYIRMKYNRDAFAGLPTVTFLVKGKTTPYVFNTSTTTYSTNPAQCLRDYLLNSTYGRGFPAALVDETSFQDAATYYNLTHSHLGAAKYTLNGALATDDNTYDNVQKILAACNSALIFSNGVYKLIPFKAANSVDTITDSHIVDSWNMSFGDKTRRFNTIRGSFPDMTDDYQQGTVTVQNTAFKTADRELLLKKDVSLDFVVDPARAKLLAYELLMQSRYQTTLELTLPHVKQILEPMDVITFEHSQITEQVATLYRVLDIQLRSDGTVKIVAQEYNSAVYTEVDPDTL